MFRRTQMTAARSQELMDELTDHGRRDLSQLRMDELEGERNVVAANVTSSSREQASEQLQDLADLSGSGKRCERISQRVGAQRVAEREQRLQQYQALPFPQQREVPADAHQRRSGRPPREGRLRLNRRALQSPENPEREGGDQRSPTPGRHSAMPPTGRSLGIDRKLRRRSARDEKTWASAVRRPAASKV